MNCGVQRFEATGLGAVAFVCFAVARLVGWVRVEAYERYYGIWFGGCVGGGDAGGADLYDAGGDAGTGADGAGGYRVDAWDGGEGR